jgi:hypothetical protein
MRHWAVAAAVLVLTALAGSAFAASPFSDWAVVVVSGDYHAAHTNNPTETFDNARRDVAAELVRKGFSAANVLQFSVRPALYPDVKPGKSDIEPIYQGLREVAARTTGGCLLYFTSHGAPQGVVIDGQIVPPQVVDQMLLGACPNRRAIVIVSACFSGVFVEGLEDSNRMILTAARPDRTSFGCSESDKYPYFDACMLQNLPGAPDFATLGPAVQACVARREIEKNARPPSEPQLFIGAAMRPVLPLMKLTLDNTRYDDVADPPAAPQTLAHHKSHHTGHPPA